MVAKVLYLKTRDTSAHPVKNAKPATRRFLESAPTIGGGDDFFESVSVGALGEELESDKKDTGLFQERLSSFCCEDNLVKTDRG
eukprot:CAMPEP_0195539862 /NCGR_PEP_ID=MMETSP0794_2-20130614/50278_1 /TAXON_ID=515487 /ORGANISM="Stephanopyxis turris, Strain CCMP 815" /LENGTH=83 /DNA_ID=CAMNT_0040673917 /DNA_START=702 /DNA_END=953 /DNA_ORIENTATION=-